MKIINFVILISILALAGCSDSRILPSDTIGTVFYFQPEGEVNLFSIEFDSDSSGTIREWNPGFDPLDPLFDPDDPAFDKDDPSDDVEVAADPLTISGLDGTRQITETTYTSNAGILMTRVWLYTFRNYGFAIFSEAPYRYNLP